MIISGIDEAGLGPILGPYCAATVQIGYPGTATDPLTLCSSILSSEAEADKLAVGDSKRIFSPGKIRELEKTVLSFHRHLFPGFTGKQSAFTFFESFSEQPSEIPWLGELKELTLPLEIESSEIDACSGRLSRSMAEEGVKLNRISLKVQTALSFNRLLQKFKNKGRVCQEILSPLLENAVRESNAVVVDRQGGRRYYGDWLIELFPGSRLAAQKELKEVSSYTVDECSIDFRVKADALNFETALASMFAKYSREIYMQAFNRYWQKKDPGLKETAGYYTDGQRFLEDLKIRNLYPEDDTLLLRKK
ncbi:MAG: hypothetical protein PQJ58_02970 [Spirochaetales bacterium]|nr:hypothetical protein [Spirochaetales bacterium]